jgi:hypothetical protein
MFVTLAEIAGVFVGFGALISVSRRGEIEDVQLVQIRGLVTVGLMAVVAALVPVGLSLYGIADHNLWLLCSLVFLSLNWASIVVGFRRPENRVLMRAQMRESSRSFGFFWLFLEVPLQLPLYLIVLGMLPHLEPALYTTSLIILLFQAVFLLTRIVHSQGSEPTT